MAPWNCQIKYIFLAFDLFLSGVALMLWGLYAAD
jgi:hypothetical protein